MKRLIRNIILLLVILFSVNLVIHFLVLPYGWGDNVLYVKYKNYREHQEEYNGLFIGGSLVYRHIDPMVIDSLAHMHGFEMHLYNLGVDGNGFVQQMQELEEVLKDPPKRLEYIFVSISSTTVFKYLNLHTRKFVTWQRPKDVWFSIRLTWEVPMPLKQKLKYSWYYFITMIENGLNAGHLFDALKFFYDPVEYDDSYLGVNRDGFYPYDYQEGRQLMSQQWEDDLLRESREVYIRDTARRQLMLEENISQFRDYDPNTPPLKIMLRKYEDMIKKCEKKGIKLIIVMPPKTRESYTSLIAVYERLPAENKISLASPLEYPEFYSPRYSYNFHHLDVHGAELYSTAFAEEFLKLEGLEVDFYSSNKPEP